MNIDVELNRVTTPAVRATVLAPVFALALFTSAALLFWVQPLVAKMLLPLLGGAPSVWNTCMVFFQALLLAGYAYALMLSQRFSLRNQAVLHALLLLAAGFVLPFTLSNRVLALLPTQSSPIGWLLMALLVTVGPPFLLLSTPRISVPARAGFCSAHAELDLGGGIRRARSTRDLVRDIAQRPQSADELRGGRSRGTRRDTRTRPTVRVGTVCLCTVDVDARRHDLHRH
jgi:hypothetical protein